MRWLAASAALVLLWSAASRAAMGDGAQSPLPPAPHAAQPAAKPAPLNPGQSAGVRAAQRGPSQTGLALIGAGGAIIAVIAVTAGSNGSNNANVQPQSQSVSSTP